MPSAASCAKLPSLPLPVIPRVRREVRNSPATPTRAACAASATDGLALPPPERAAAFESPPTTASSNRVLSTITTLPSQAVTPSTGFWQDGSKLEASAGSQRRRFAGEAADAGEVPGRDGGGRRHPAA